MKVCNILYKFAVYPLVITLNQVQAIERNFTLVSTKNITPYRYELTIQNKEIYTNPIIDVKLLAEFEHTNGTTLNMKGFFDGKSTWKVRFAPNLTGEWKYTLNFTDRSNKLHGTLIHKEILNKISTATDLNSANGLLTQYAKNPIWFAKGEQNPILIRSFHVGDRFFASNWSKDERKAFLDWFEGQGYNMLSVASFFLNRNAEGRGKGWNTPKLWPSDPAEYQKAEKILDDLEKRGIMIYPFAGHFGQSSNFPLDKDEQIEYIDYTLARFGSYKNMLFNVAGPEPIAKSSAFKNAMKHNDIARLGKLLVDRNPNGHLVSIHNKPGNDPFKNESWLGYITLQGAKKKEWDAMFKYYQSNHTGTKPIYAQECFWPGNKHHDKSDWSLADIRKKGIIMLIAGTTINYADMDGNSSSGFSGSLKLSDKNQKWHDEMKKVWDFFESIPFYEMKPITESLKNIYTMGKEDEMYLSYFPNGANFKWNKKGGLKGEWISADDFKAKGNKFDIQKGQDIESPSKSGWILFAKSSTSTALKKNSNHKLKNLVFKSERRIDGKVKALQ